MPFQVYNISTVPDDINYPDIYFTPEYGKACEQSDGAVWELCQYKDLIYVYLKKEYAVGSTVYYDLITPYGYSGYWFKEQATFDEFILLFRTYAFDQNFLTEVVRQTPYLGVDISSDYSVIATKPIFSIETTNFDNYYTTILKSSTRNIIKNASILNYSYKMVELNEESIQASFLDMYNQTMVKVNASPYYYFNPGYYAHMGQLPNCKLICIYDKSNCIIGSSIIFIYKEFVHYHLSCNDNSSNCITNFLLNSVIREIGIGKKIIIGGGLTANDSLHSFKKKISTTRYEYVVYKHVFNETVCNKIAASYDAPKGYFPIHRQ